MTEKRLGILELDNLLKEVLQEGGFQGETVGELLRAGEGKIKNYEAAWEAHKIRNRIAHEGALFEGDSDLFQRAYRQYTDVFSEFGKLTI